MDIAQKPVYKLNLAAGTAVINLTTPLVEGDDRAQTFTLELSDKGMPANLSGYSVTAYFGRGKTADIEADTIPVHGTVSGNIAKITLTDSCYSRSCYFSMPIRLTSAQTGQKRTCLIVRGTVVKSVDGKVIDPDGSVPSLDDLFAQIAVMERTRQAAEEATEDAIAAAERADAARQNIQSELENLAGDIEALTPPDHISNCWSIHAHQEDFMVLENGSTTPVHAYLDYSTYHFGVMNVHPGRMVYRDNVTDALFQKCSYMFRVVSVGKFEFGTKDGNGENQGILCWVSPAERLFKIFTSAWDGNNEIKRNLTLDFDMLPGEIYVAEIVKQGLQQTTIRMSCTTDANKKFEYTHTATGNQLNNKLRVCGGVAFHAIESTAEFKLYEMAQKVYVDEKYDLLIIGDSFVECGNTEVEASKSFAYMVHEMIGDKCNASGHGGATTAKVISRLRTDADIGLYKYAFLQVGSNDSAQSVTLDKFKANMGTIIAFVESKGAIPILTTIPVRADVGNTAFIAEANQWIKETGHMYVDEYTMLTSDKLVSDGIHPNEEGNQLILLALMGLIPECF